jgi:RND family efflux transporter MFP subunit
MTDIAATPAPAAAEAPKTARRLTVQQRRRRRWLIIVGVLVVIIPLTVGVALELGVVDRLFGPPVPDENLFLVEPVTLNVTLKEEGEVKAVDSVDLKCEVQSQGVTIEWIIEESTRVRKGDLLVKLASEEFKDRVETAEIELKRVSNALEEARRELEIIEKDNASNIKKAEIDLEVAQLELKRYVEGDFEKSKKNIDIQIKQATIDIDQLKEELAKHRELLVDGFTTQSKIDELEDALEKNQMTLAMRQLELEILRTYEFKKNSIQKQSAVERAAEELEREKDRADLRRKQALAKVNDQEQTLDVRTRRFERLKDQLAKCEIRAPADGVVQYGESGGRRRWNSNRIAVGERVYGGQTLITLPDTSQMMVTTRIHEADRHKVEEGLPCIVRVPAVPGETFHGTLSKIAQFADSEGSWWNPELKEHATEILLEDTDAPLSPGDSAYIEIVIEEVPDVLAVPVQCVFVRGDRRFAFAVRGQEAEPVEITIGRTSTTLAEVTSGLEPGDRVVLAPDEPMLAKLPAPGTAREEVEEAKANSKAKSEKTAGGKGSGKPQSG